MRPTRSTLLMLFSLLALDACASRPAADAFDIVCTGSTSRVRGESHSFWAHYRIDLKRRQWCDGPCREVRPILATGANGVLTLDQSWYGFSNTTVTFDPGTDRLSIQELYQGELHLTTDAVCGRSVFRGFPGDPPQGGPLPTPPTPGFGG